MSSIFESAKQLKEDLIEIRRTIHQCPEAGPVLPETKAFVMNKLKEYGYQPNEICESGIVATIKGEQPGKTILLRADMDALAIKEEAPVPFASKNNYMHACGHDMHTTMLLGAARLLKQHQNEIKGTVKLVFQPDEEGFTGAKSMLKAGVLTNPTVDAGMALHVNSGTPSGMVLCGLGTCMAGCTLFRIRVKGKGCHGAMPETGIDPINIAAHIYLSLQEIIAREVAPVKPAVVTIGKFSGGKAPNIIPEEVILEGTIRTLDRDLSAQIYQRIEEISTLTAALFRGEAQVTEISSAPPLHNDEEMTSTIAGYLKEAYDPNKVVVFNQGGMGSEDFASYTYEIPCSYLLLGAGTAQENELYGKPMHNDHVVFNEDVLPLGSAILVYSALRWLEEHA
ncbi:M20 metallopeptidase family protein [Blautia sp. HCP3S3_G3]|uniref:M20 metallopeptidase family protein n=1 Tax=Blautia sp. HCP3S3_G3 TaxID=3438913 RepID=UPI003F89EE47